MKKYEAIIFDLDGTLLNTLEDLTDAVNACMKRHGYPEHTLEEVRHFVGNGIRKLMERALPEEVTGELFESRFEEFRTYYTEHCQNKTKAYDGVMELLKTLNQKGYSMAIVSNKNQAAVTELNRIYFQDYIETAIGQKDGIRKKPAPDTVLQALRELGKEKETALYVGDSEVDFMTAENTGMDCVLVTWGFRTPKELEKFQPKAFVKNTVELFEFLENEPENLQV